MVKNLAKEAREAVANFLNREVTQEAFAALLFSTPQIIAECEHSATPPKDDTLRTTLGLILQSPEKMLIAIVQIHLSDFLRSDVSFETTTHLVSDVLRKHGTAEGRRKASLHLLLKVFEEKNTRQGATLHVADEIE